MREKTFDQTDAGWDEYYTSLESPHGNKFKNEHKKYMFTHTWRNSVRVIEKYADINDGDKILDAGGGWGRMIWGILENHNSLQVTVVDFQESALKIGKELIGSKKGGNSISWEVGNLESLNYPDSSFDRIYSSRVFQHLNSPEKGAAEIVRTLKPGGKFVIYIQNKLCPLNINYYSRVYTPSQVKSWFKDIRLSELHVSTMDFCPTFIGSMQIEKTMEKMPVLNLFGGKVVLWGTK